VGLALDNGRLLDSLLTLGKDELDVAGVGHVGVDLDSESVSLVNFQLWNVGQHTRP
jgi:hypothetical protein